MINFRSYQYQEIDFHPSFNLFLGGNAQGKTNIVEAIHLCAKGRSFKNVRDHEMIRFGERSCYVRADMNIHGRSKQVECKLSMVDPKRVRINQIEIENIKELSNQFDLVLFAPEDLKIIQSGPFYRREFINEILKGLDPKYVSILSEYRKILFQRNKFLKGNHDQWFDQQMKALDTQLIELAFPIHKLRIEVSKLMEEWFNFYHQRLTLSEDVISFSYQSNISSDTKDKEEFQDLYREKLQESLERDCQQGNTDIGPHKDDWEISISGLSSRKYASQGQVRTLVLALKLAEAAMYKKINQTEPILLLDDVFSELDEARANNLLQAIKEYQSMITTNDWRKKSLLEGSVFQIEKGHVLRKENYGKESRV